MHALWEKMHSNCAAGKVTAIGRGLMEYVGMMDRNTSLCDWRGGHFILLCYVTRNLEIKWLIRGSDVIDDSCVVTTVSEK